MTDKYIGELGTPHEEIKYTFGYFGQMMRAHPDAGELSYIDFLGKALEVDEEDEAEGYKLTMEFLKQQVHPDDWDVFWQTAKENRQTVKDIMQVSQKILEEVSGFPTGQPSDSPASQPKRSRKSKAVSSSTPAVFRHMKGRPDLKQAVALAPLPN